MPTPHTVSGPGSELPRRGQQRRGVALLAGLLMLVACHPAFSEMPLLYAPFDGSPDAVIAGGSARNLHPEQTFVQGKSGQAIQLASDCEFEVPGNFNASEGTVSMLFCPQWDPGDTQGHHLFCIYGQPDLPNAWAINRWNLTFSNGQLTFSIFSREEGKVHGISAPLGDRPWPRWWNVAITWRNVNSGEPDGEMRLYLHGKLVAELTGKQIDVGPTNTVMSIGRDQDASPDYAMADIDELFIYGRALTAQEIEDGNEWAFGEAGEPLPGPAEGTTQRPLKGWWDARWPYRASVTVPAADEARENVTVQCPLRLDAQLAELGVPGRVNPPALRVIEDGVTVVPARVEDGIVEWQVPDPIPAGETRQFDLYFQAAEYRVFGPLQAICDAPEAEPGPEAPAALDYATIAYGKAWDFDDGTFSGIDQWGNKPEYIKDKRVEDGVLSMQVEQDPWFIWGDMWGQVDATEQKVAIDLTRFPVLEMRVWQSVNQANWDLYGRAGASTQLLHYEFPVIGAGWHRIRIDLREEARWRGVLSAFRIDPTSEVKALVKIDWVRLISATPVEHAALETIGRPSGVAAEFNLVVPASTVQAGSTQDVTVTVTGADGKPVARQPVLFALAEGSGGRLGLRGNQRSLALSTQARRGLTDDDGRLTVAYTASEKAAAQADKVCASLELLGSLKASVTVSTVPGPPHHYRVDPASVAAIKEAALPLPVSAQLVDAFGNPVAESRDLTWSTDEPGAIAAADARLNDSGLARAQWTGVEAQRWVYHIRVKDDQGLDGESAAICLLPSKPRKDPIVLGDNGYFRKGPDGPAWLPLGGFYANWVGLPDGGEEGRRLISFVDATEEQLAHWLDFLAGEGVTGLRFMLRAHTPRGMEPMDVIGRVNMPLFAKVLRYMDLARKHDIRFMLTIHEDYTKPAYFNKQALETFCIPRYAGEDLDALPPHQRRFVRDEDLLELIEDKYTDPDVMACQDQYARELIGLLKDNPQLFSWEFENEMVNCPQSWANHAAKVIRDADPITPICASHGGGGLHTADPLWWTRETDIDFYTYHLYSHRGSTSAVTDYGAACDILTCYGRMAPVSMFGESAGDEFGRYPKERDADRRYIMRDIIWFSLANGNPGCFFWNARGFEVEEFRLANQIVNAIDWRDWAPAKPEVGLIVDHPWEDDKYYRSPDGLADYAMMGRYAQHYLSAGIDFDFTMDGEGYAKTSSLAEFSPCEGKRLLRPTEGWQVRTNACADLSRGLAYVRNFAGVWNWAEAEGNRGADMFLRDRKPAPLRLALDLPHARVSVTATNLDTAEVKRFDVAGSGEIDLGVSGHDWAVVWSGE